MENARIFFDHLVFALVSVFVVLLVVNLIFGGFVPEFSLADHFWLAVAVWTALSAAVAAALTFASIRKNAPDSFDFTRRRY